MSAWVRETEHSSFEAGGGANERESTDILSPDQGEILDGRWLGKDPGMVYVRERVRLLGTKLPRSPIWIPY